MRYLLLFLSLVLQFNVSGYNAHIRTSLSNLQGIPRHIHRQVVSPAWSAFRKANPNPTRAQVIQQAMRIDKQIAEHIGRIN